MASMNSDTSNTSSKQWQAHHEEMNIKQPKYCLSFYLSVCLSVSFFLSLSLSLTVCMCACVSVYVRR